MCTFLFASFTQSAAPRCIAEAAADADALGVSHVINEASFCALGHVIGTLCAVQDFECVSAHSCGRAPGHACRRRGELLIACAREYTHTHTHTHRCCE